MHILYYFWNENSADDIEDAFAALGHQCMRFSMPLKNYDSDLEFETQIDRFIQQHKIDLIYTFNYFPILSSIAMKHGILYVAWIYDCPHLTLYSKTINNPCNYLFLFDRQMVFHANRLAQLPLH